MHHRALGMIINPNILEIVRLARQRQGQIKLCNTVKIGVSGQTEPPIDPTQIQRDGSRNFCRAKIIAHGIVQCALAKKIGLIRLKHLHNRCVIHLQLDRPCGPLIAGNDQITLAHDLEILHHRRCGGGVGSGRNSFFDQMIPCLTVEPNLNGAVLHHDKRVAFREIVQI